MTAQTFAPRSLESLRVRENHALHDESQRFLTNWRRIHREHDDRVAAIKADFAEQSTRFLQGKLEQAA